MIVSKGNFYKEGFWVKFEGTGIEKVSADLNKLDFIMESEGFVRADQWDYERVTYDRKYNMVEGRFTYGSLATPLREMSAPKAHIQLLTPLLENTIIRMVLNMEKAKISLNLLFNPAKTLNQLKEKLEAITVEDKSTAPAAVLFIYSYFGMSASGTASFAFFSRPVKEDNSKNRSVYNLLNDFHQNST